MRRLILPGSLAVLLVSCGSSSPEPAMVKPAPSFVSIDVLGAVIGPSKTDGSAWDGLGGPVPNAALKDLAKALGAEDPYAAAVPLLLNLASKGFAPPDVYGWAELLREDAPPARVPLAITQDSYTPSWYGAGWQHIPWSQGVRVRIVLIDKDLKSDDPIGTSELDWRVLNEALERGGNYRARVDDQTAQQVLLVGISVREER